MDAEDRTGNKARNLLRRAEALMGLRQWGDAIADLKSPLVAKLPDAQRLLKTATEAKAKEATRSRKMWAGAFAKAAAEPDEGGSGGDGADPANEAVASSRSVRFASPQAAPAPGTPGSAMRTPSGGSGAVGAAGDEETPDKTASSQRRLFAGATPFPGAKARSATSSAGEGATAASAGGGTADATAVKTVEGEGEASATEGGGSIWPWLLGGAAVVAGAAAVWFLSRGRGGATAARK